MRIPQLLHLGSVLHVVRLLHMGRPLPVGRRQAGRLLPVGLWLVGMLPALCGCRASRQDSPPQVDYFSWINPITGVHVSLPEGWRQSPETASRGETTVGYFTPNFSGLLQRYGNITLHYEYVAASSPPMTLRRFVENFRGYMGHLGRLVDPPVFGQEGCLEVARLSYQADYSHRHLLLEVRFWTPDRRDYWYAVVEHEIEDEEFPRIARPVVDLLQESTLRR